MKKIALLLSVFTALFTVSCSVHVTKDIKEVFVDYEKSIEYHDVAYMKSRKLEVPHNVDEKNYRQMKFVFGFKQDDTDGINTPKESTINWLTPREWKTFKRDFEHGISRTNRFAPGQLRQILADDKVRSDNEKGIVYVEDLDPSKMHLVEGIVNVFPTVETSDSVSDISFFRGGGQLKKTNTTMKLICTPLYAKNNEVIDAFQSFSVQTFGAIQQRINDLGDPIGGLVMDGAQVEALHQALGAVTLINAINKIYSTFPVGGPILNFDPDDGKGVAIIKAAADEGLQPEMQFVIYAMKKSDGDAAIRVPLFNATLVTLGRTGNSTLRVWRENTSSKTAKEIIKKFRTDFNAAKREYDFYGCSDGLAEWPSEIIDRPFPED